MYRTLICFVFYWWIRINIDLTQCTVTALSSPHPTPPLPPSSSKGVCQLEDFTISETRMLSVPKHTHVSQFKMLPPHGRPMYFAAIRKLFPLPPWTPLPQPPTLPPPRHPANPFVGDKALVVNYTPCVFQALLPPAIIYRTKVFKHVRAFTSGQATCNASSLNLSARASLIEGGTFPGKLYGNQKEESWREGEKATTTGAETFW